MTTDSTSKPPVSIIPNGTPPPIPSPLSTPAIVTASAGTANAGAGTGNTSDPSGGSSSGSNDGSSDGSPSSTPQSFQQTLFDLFTSKKFLATLIAIAVWIAGKIGLNADPAVLDRIWIALMVYVFGQGVADVGKGRAVAAARLAQKASLFMLLGFGALTMNSGCTAQELKSALQAGEVIALDCGAVDLSSTLTDINGQCKQTTGTQATIDNQCASNLAKKNLGAAGGCAVIKLLDDAIADIQGATPAPATGGAANAHIMPVATATGTTGASTEVQRWQTTLDSFRQANANGAKYLVNGKLR